MARLARSVYVRDPVKHRVVLLNAGDEPAPELAALVKNPAGWENGELPRPGGADTSVSATSGTPAKDDTKAAPAAKKPAARKSAATKPARGRDAADEGTSGD